LKYTNIAITGKYIASGSTTLAKKLAEAINWKFVSGGRIFRKYCDERGWPIERYKDLPDEVDFEVDKRAKNILIKEKHVIYESWLAGWISRDMPHVFKVLCTSPLSIRIKRFANREGESSKSAKEKVLLRDRTTIEKHKRLYKITDQFDKKYFDLVLETNKLTPEQEVEIVIKKLNL